MADTSGLLASMDERSPDGAAAKDALDRAGTVVVPPPLLAELDHLTCRILGREAALESADDIRRWARQGRVVLPEVDAEVLDTAAGLRKQYADLRLDLVDAITVAFAARFRTNKVLTLDRRDFRAVRPLSDHDAFCLIPDDR